MSIKRRDFMALLGGAAVASPGIARAQQARMPVIGFLGGGSPEMFTDQLAKFRLGPRRDRLDRGTECAHRIPFGAG